MPTPANQLRAFIGFIRLLPAGARLLQRPVRQTGRAKTGFTVVFMSGFAVSAAQLSLPGTGSISYSEMVEIGPQHLRCSFDSANRRQRHRLWQSIECETHR